MITLSIHGYEVLIIGRRFFLIRSSTAPDWWYAVDLESDEDGEPLGCECPGWSQFHVGCWHMRLSLRLVTAIERVEDGWWAIGGVLR